MPLNTQVLRNGKPVPGGGNWWIVGAMMIAASIDSGKGPFEENTFMGIEGRERPSEWHDPNYCSGLDQDKDDQFLCTGCAKAFPVVIGVSFMNRSVHYGTLGMTPLNDGRYTVKNGPYMFADQMSGKVFTIETGDVLVAFRSS